MSTLRAYHNDPTLKAQIVKLMRWHQQQDRLIKGVYQDTETDVFRGCAVGCTLRSLQEITGVTQEYYGVHARYETLIGVPQALAGVHDRLFETLPTPENQAFAVDFLEAVPVGTDLSRIWPKLAVWLLTDPDYGVAQYLDEQSTIADDVADLYQQLIAGTEVTHQQWVEARAAVRRVRCTFSGLSANLAIFAVEETARVFMETDSRRAVMRVAESVGDAAEAAEAAGNATSDSYFRFPRACRDELLRLLAAAPLASR